MKQTFTSFTKAFEALGYKVKPAKEKAAKGIKCNKCGGLMVHISGTNIIQCTGTITDKEGNEKPCSHFIFTHN